MLNLNTPIEKLVHVGPRSLPRLKKLGIKTVKDLLWHFPYRHEDYSHFKPIAAVVKDETVNIQGQIVKIDQQKSWKKRLTITTALIKDDSAVIRAVWFNRPYLAETLLPESEVSIAGKVKLDQRGLYLASPAYEKITGRTAQSGFTHTGRLVPIYPETSGLTSKYLRFLIKPLLKVADNLSDPLPVALLTKYQLPILSEAVRQLHFPENQAAAEKARERLAFDELLLFQLKSLLGRRRLMQLPAPTIKLETEEIKKMVDALPFILTSDQKVAAFEILKDLEKKYPMNRLLNGDVGSGKTVVAFLAACLVVRQDWQVVMLAPTEILAQQHYATIKSLLSEKWKAKSEKKIELGLLTGSKARQWPTDQITQEVISKKKMQEKIARGEIKIIIGTHAVIQKKVKFHNLALVVIDEQHRFGVSQRQALTRGQNALIPHLLSMTATPIPRTLALTIYGDLDISLIKEKPANRRAIITKIVSEAEKKKAYQFLDKEIDSDRQVFVICPRIELSNPQETVNAGKQNKLNVLWAEVKAVTEEYEKLAEQIFPHRRVAMLHGKMKAKEKEKIMRDFKEGRFDILVATSVIEVGIDIPNCSVMLIENAERFGLAQLHQFRGRVGRAEHQSYCLLINGSGQQTENQRLKALEINDDGFKLAEEDLRLRGPGEFIGTKQSGLPDLAMASLANLELIKKARQEAKLLLKEDPSLKNYPLLKNQLSQFQKIRHFE